jgi:hypothetical protein
MAASRFRVDELAMGKHLRRALERLWTWLWRKRGPISVKAEPGQNASGRSLERARFWTEFRDGQREAEANSARPR